MTHNFSNAEGICHICHVELIHFASIIAVLRHYSITGHDKLFVVIHILAVQSDGMDLSVNCGVSPCSVILVRPAPCSWLQWEGIRLPAVSQSSVWLVCSTRCSCSAVWVSECWCVSGRRTAIGRKEKCVCMCVVGEGNTMKNVCTHTKLCVRNPCLKWSKSSVCLTMRVHFENHFSHCIERPVYICMRAGLVCLLQYVSKPYNYLYNEIFLCHISVFSNNS